MNTIHPNPGKNETIVVNEKTWMRLPIKTHIITKDDSIVSVVETYTKPYIQKNDIIFISEKIVAISQGRAFKIKDIHPSFLATLLVKFVHKSPHGIGLGSPWTMELAIREVGSMRILVAALASLLTKPFGIKGIFYKVVGNNINAIDGPCEYTLPPYNEYAKLGPAQPNKVAREISAQIGNDVVIIDANDLGVSILGKSNESLSDTFCQKVFRDNPLGQSKEQTPLCIVRQSVM